jgi:RNA polymerase sigma factor (sigma-70 family)
VEERSGGDARPYDMSLLSIGPVRAAQSVPDWDFDEVYRSSWTKVVRLAYVTTGSLGTAEEIAQDVFADLYHHRAAVYAPHAWLWRATANRTTSWLRRRVTERRYQHHARPQAHVPASVTDFMALLSPLPARQRAALFLRYHEDLTVDEIAEVLGCRPGTVKSSINRALARLREGMTTDA